MTIKFAINQSVINQCQTEDFISLSAQAGFNAVELRVPRLKESLYRIPASTLSKHLKKHGISVLSINSIDDFSMVPEENLDILKMECEFIGRMCEILECPMVVAPVARWYGPPLPVEEIKSISQARLSYVADILARFGVVTGFEPICFPEHTVRDLALAQDIIDGSTAKSVGFVLDIYNLFRGGITPDDIVGLRYPTYLMHINDAEDAPLENLDVLDNREFPGEGVANAREWVNASIRSGYEGHFSLEIFQQRIWAMNPENALALCSEKLSRFAASLD